MGAKNQIDTDWQILDPLCPFFETSIVTIDVIQILSKFGACFDFEMYIKNNFTEIFYFFSTKLD